VEIISGPWFFFPPFAINAPKLVLYGDLSLANLTSRYILKIESFAVISFTLSSNLAIRRDQAVDEILELLSCFIV